MAAGSSLRSQQHALSGVKRHRPQGLLPRLPLERRRSRSSPMVGLELVWNSLRLQLQGVCRNQLANTTDWPIRTTCTG